MRSLEENDCLMTNSYGSTGVIAEGADGLCEIVNPIYHYCIMQAFKPIVNGLEQEYLPQDTRTGFRDYLTPDGQLQMEALLDNFRCRLSYNYQHFSQLPAG